jgi:sigma-B regulation protein RsbU (phosphoserine phosphatase)
LPIAIQRVLLIVLLLFAGIPATRFSVWTVHSLLHPETIPILPLDVDPSSLEVTGARRYAAEAGVRNGEVLLAINGRPVTSFIQARRELFRVAPGTPAVLLLQPKAGPPRTLAVTLPGRTNDDWLDWPILLSLNVVTPWFCILLGFLVAWYRPSNQVGTAVLWLLLSLAFMQSANNDVKLSWEPWFTWSILTVDSLASMAWPAAWLYFALVFPDPRSPHRLWGRLCCWLTGLFGTFSLVRSLFVVALLHWPAVWPWFAPLNSLPLAAVDGYQLLLVVLGLANFLYKLRHETQPDLRRRLRWTLSGLALGIVPYTLLIASSVILHKDLNTYPPWLLLPGIFSPFFVPLTLAYSVLVDRLFDIGVVLRQGLLASQSVAVLRSLLLGVLIWRTFASHVWWEPPLFIAAMFFVARGSERLRLWVDRRFFREAVSGEQVLVELSQEVRLIPDRDRLIETVRARIQQALHVTRVELLPAAPASANGDLLLPLSTKDQHYGVLCLGPKMSQEPYTQRDRQLLESVATQTALALEVTRLTAAVAEEAVQRERIHNELEIARQVQQRLFPKRAPAVEGLDLAGHCVPAQSIGGDYYDFILTPSGEVGLAMGDVAGKGVPAALLMAALQSSLRGLTLGGVTDLSDLMGKLNLLIYEASPANRFATFFYGLYDPAGRRLRYCSAGHNPALLLKADGEASWLRTPGVGLGMTRGARYQQAEVTLSDGDTLVLYTDGVTEARNVAEEEFGEERLEAAVRRCGGGAEQTLCEVLRVVDEFASGAPQHDDITILVAKVTRPSV